MALIVFVLIPLIGAAVVKGMVLASGVAFAIIAFSVISNTLTEDDDAGGKVLDMADGVVKLPDLTLKGDVSLEETLSRRRSRRSYKEGALTLSQVGQLLWAAQGKTTDWGGRTAPSAGATYPLEVYLVAGAVEGLDAGIYRYVPDGHELELMSKGDIREELARHCLGQSMVSEAPIDIVLSAVYERTTGRYGQRGVMYVHMEAGHAGQDIYLQSEALGLGTVAVGAFSPKDVAALLGLPGDMEPLYIFPVGKV